MYIEDYHIIGLNASVKRRGERRRQSKKRRRSIPSRINLLVHLPAGWLAGWLVGASWSVHLHLYTVWSDSASTYCSSDRGLCGYEYDSIDFMNRTNVVNKTFHSFILSFVLQVLTADQNFLYPIYDSDE